MIVVDSNVIAYLYLPSEHMPTAETLVLHDAASAAPLLWRSEFRNILSGDMRRAEQKFTDTALKIPARTPSLSTPQQKMNRCDASRLDRAYIIEKH